jgi:hypothetical protein
MILDYARVSTAAKAASERRRMASTRDAVRSISRLKAGLRRNPGEPPGSSSIDYRLQCPAHRTRPRLPHMGRIRRLIMSISPDFLPEQVGLRRRRHGMVGDELLASVISSSMSIVAIEANS